MSGAEYRRCLNFLLQTLYEVVAPMILVCSTSLFFGSMETNGYLCTPKIIID